MIDKTDTLTEGKPKLVTLELADGREDLEMFRLLASLEMASEHPLASASVAGAKERALQFTKPDNFTSITLNPAVGILRIVPSR